MTILIAGATGNQGGSVVDALLDKGHTLRALTRNRTSEKAVALASRGVEIAEGDFTNSAALVSALSGAEAAFLVSTPFEAGTDAETAQGIAFVDAAAAAGLSHLVYTSVADADRNTGIPHFESKFKVEKHLIGSGVRHTIIAPAFFYDNMMAPFMMPGLQQGALAMAMPATATLQMISARDIGRFAAHVLEHGTEFLGKRINISGDELTGHGYAQALSAASGKDIGYMEVPIEQVRSMSEDMALMYEWFVEVGYSADIEGLRRRYPDVGWERFSEWANRQDWSVLDQHIAAAD